MDGQFSLFNSFKVHIRHIMLYEYRKGNNASVATKNITDIYPNALDVRKCQRWFSRFRKGNYDLFDSDRTGRPKTLDNNVLRAAVEANPRQTIRELATTFNLSRSTVQEHLKQIGKVNAEGVWVSIEKIKSENELNRGDKQSGWVSIKKIKTEEELNTGGEESGWISIKKIKTEDERNTDGEESGWISNTKIKTEDELDIEDEDRVWVSNDKIKTEDEQNTGEEEQVMYNNHKAQDISG